MNKQIINSIIRDADATRRRIKGATQGKSVEDARLAIVKEILALGQSLIQTEAVNPDISILSLEVVDEADKDRVMLAGYAMRLAREVGNGNLTKAQIGNTLSVIEMAGAIDSEK